MLPTVEPTGWTPLGIRATQSSRPVGMLPGATHAWRGLPELSPGQGLSGVQQAILAPFLANEFRLPEGVVAADLAAVRLHFGALAGLKGSTAVTVGHDIYVPTPALVTEMLGWKRRRWLVHELGHTMQWRALAGHHDGAGSGDVAGTKQFLQRYVGGIPAAVGRGTYRWIRERGTSANGIVTGTGPHSFDQPEPDLAGLSAGAKRRSLQQQIHDAHKMEQQAEDPAQRFLAATSPTG